MKSKREMETRVMVVFRKLGTNETFRLYSDGGLYETGPTFSNVLQHHEVHKIKDDHDFDTVYSPTGIGRGQQVDTVTDIPEFAKRLLNNQGALILYLDHSLAPPRSAHEISSSRGRRWIWVKWLSADDGREYALKSDFTVRGTNEYQVVGRLTPSTNVPQFIDRLREQGHTILFAHKKVGRTLNDRG